MPKNKQISDGNEDEIEDFVKKSSEQLQAKSAKKHKRVKIGVPSLTHVSTIMGTAYYVMSKYKKQTHFIGPLHVFLTSVYVGLSCPAVTCFMFTVVRFG